MGLPLHSRQVFKALNSASHSRCLVSTMSSYKGLRGVDYKWPFPDFRKSQRFWDLKSRITIFLVGMAGRTLLNVLNRSKVHNKDILIDAIYKRPPGIPLITVSNHESCMDDPGLIALALSPTQLADQKNMRWSLAAHDICFTRPLYTSFFSLGKCIPIVRGHGVYQKSVDFAIERLNEVGDWLHVFPEGRVNMEREKIYRIKWGIGRIISELKSPPIVIPFHHTGMSEVLPNRTPYFPRIGKKVFMNVGNPLNMQPILDSTKEYSPRDQRKAIADFLQSEMEKLRLVTLQLSEDYRNGKLKS